MINVKELGNTVFAGKAKPASGGGGSDNAANKDLSNLSASGEAKLAGEEWQKPAEWVDIRSGALPNSVYMLVGHSADYSTYPTLPIKASVSNSGTYDIYIDGIKQFSAVASGTESTITWQTLALTSGRDVTYPAALKTHIVRVTPTSSSNELTALSCGATTVKGILWVHFTTTEAISLYQLLTATGAVWADRAPVCQAITSDNGELEVTSLSGAFNFIKNLIELPVFIGKGNTYADRISTSDSFRYCTGIKKIKFKDLYCSDSYGLFRECNSLQEVSLENSHIAIADYSFANCFALKKLPSPLPISSLASNSVLALSALEPTFIDFSDGTTATKVDAHGTSGHTMYGLKGLTVSSSAPFSSSTSPQINVSYTGLDRSALVHLFNSMPTVTDSQVINVTGCTGAASLTAEDLAIATEKGWTVTR